MNFFRVISNLLRFDRTNWTALALCLFAAAIFWIFNALNKNYSTNLSLPLQVEFDQTKFAVAEVIPAKLRVNVSGNGWELLRKSLGQKVPVITLPLERPVETRKIPGSALAPQVVSQLGTLQLNFVVMDTLRLTIEPRVSRKIKLMADISGITFKKDMGRISPIVVLPDTVILEGPSSYLDALGDTLRIPVKASRVGSNFQESIEVVVDHVEFISRNPPVTEVMFDVGMVEEFSLQVRLSRPRNGSSVDIDRDSVSCAFVIPQHEHERFLQDAAGMAAVLPPTQLSKGEMARVIPILAGMPVYATLVRVDSVELRRYK